MEVPQPGPRSRTCSLSGASVTAGRSYPARQPPCSASGMRGNMWGVLLRLSQSGTGGWKGLPRRPGLSLLSTCGLPRVAGPDVGPRGPRSVSLRSRVHTHSREGRRQPVLLGPPRPPTLCPGCRPKPGRSVCDPQRGRHLRVHGSKASRVPRGLVPGSWARWEATVCLWSGEGLPWDSP